MGIGGIFEKAIIPKGMMLIFPCFRAGNIYSFDFK
jgi:hypothetical protein